MNQTLRYLTIILLIIWVGYWKLKANQAQKEKPEIKKDRTPIYLLSKYSFWFLDGIILLQLAGLSLLPSGFGIAGQIMGFSLVSIGFIIAIFARISLSSNWSNAFDYQIKKKHELVAQGVYTFIRHPIYTGMILAGTGAELVADSFIFIPVFIGMFVWAYIQAKNEELILSVHFGKSYKDYMMQTWMFAPYII